MTAQGNPGSAGGLNFGLVGLRNHTNDPSAWVLATTSDVAFYPGVLKVGLKYWKCIEVMFFYSTKLCMRFMSTFHYLIYATQFSLLLISVILNLFNLHSSQNISNQMEDNIKQNNNFGIGFTSLCCGSEWSAVMFTRRIIDRIGYFDENFYPAYYEVELEWNAGWFLCPTLCCLHSGIMRLLSTTLTVIS